MLGSIQWSKLQIDAVRKGHISTHKQLKSPKRKQPAARQLLLKTQCLPQSVEDSHPKQQCFIEMLHATDPGIWVSKAMASLTSDMKNLKLLVEDKESDTDQDFDLNSHDLYTDVVYLNTVDDK